MGRSALTGTPKCYRCKVELQVGVNWHECRYKTNKRICKACNNAITRECERRWREQDFGRVKERSWGRRGIPITFEEFSKKNVEQSGKCAICGRVPKNRPLVPDHNHTTGALRDLLCTPCNVAIASFESPLTTAYLFYLEKWRTK